MTTLPTMSFVTIAYNGADHIGGLLDSLLVALERVDWPGVEVLVVDDGSTDDTVAVVEQIAAGAPVPIRVHSQPNSGRLVATRTGVQQANGESVCVLGTRMRMHPDSLANLAELMRADPSRRVWNCHIDVPSQGNYQAQFWNSLNFVGWRRYLANPRLVSMSPAEFDYYPSGTGGFVCPRELLAEGYENLDSIYADDQARYASDDTAVLRYINSRELIWMSPDYSADYLARTAGAAFVKHTFDRGTMFLDSYLRPGTRLFWPTIGVLAASVPLAGLAIARPKTLLAIPAAVGAATAGLAALGAKPRDLPGFALLSPVFGVVFTAGMWKGLGMLARNRFRSGK